MRGRIGGDDFHGISTIRQQAGVEGVGFVGDVVFEQQPTRFSVAAVVDGIDELILVLVVSGPLHSDGIAVVHAGDGRFEVRGRRSTDISPDGNADRFREGLIAGADLYRDVFDIGSNIFCQVVERNAIYGRPGIGRV